MHLPHLHGKKQEILTASPLQYTILVHIKRESGVETRRCRNGHDARSIMHSEPETYVLQLVRECICEGKWVVVEDHGRIGSIANLPRGTTGGELWNDTKLYMALDLLGELVINPLGDSLSVEATNDNKTEISILHREMDDQDTTKAIFAKHYLIAGTRSEQRRFSPETELVQAAEYKAELESRLEQQHEKEQEELMALAGDRLLAAEATAELRGETNSSNAALKSAQP